MQCQPGYSSCTFEICINDFHVCYCLLDRSFSSIELSSVVPELVIVLTESQVL